MSNFVFYETIAWRVKKKKKTKFAKGTLDRLCLEKKTGRHYVCSGIGFKAALTRIYGRINIVYRNKTR